MKYASETIIRVTNNAALKEYMPRMAGKITSLTGKSKNIYGVQFFQTVEEFLPGEVQGKPGEAVYVRYDSFEVVEGTEKFPNIISMAGKLHLHHDGKPVREAGVMNMVNVIETLDHICLVEYADLTAKLVRESDISDCFLCETPLIPDVYFLTDMKRVVFAVDTMVMQDYGFDTAHINMGVAYCHAGETFNLELGTKLATVRMQRNTLGLVEEGILREVDARFKESQQTETPVVEESATEATE